ncbi:E3 Ubiquitin-Protein Ligase Trim58 [Manis pentadactyla]|nr:E3 Ubiquitin-Protein Ligase Trim58 [Manis pentadactyla]
MTGRPVSLLEKVEVQRQRFRLEYEKSRGFLAREERLQLRRLEEEERATLHGLREGRARLAQQGRALKELAEELEERCHRPAAALLEFQGVREVLRRSKDILHLDLETVPMELKTMYHIPGMPEMLRKFQVDVKLDPSTAHPSLLLTADLRSVQDTELWRDVPNNAERFDTWPCVLGLQDFPSGRHYWEVVVGERAQWGLGICRDTVSRKGETTPSPENGVWVVWLLKEMALVGNILLILLIQLDARPHAPMYFLLSQLPLVDVMTVSTTVPRMAADFLTKSQAITFIGCRTQTFVFLALTGTEALLLGFMSHDRYVAICHPLRYCVLMSRKICRFTVTCTWASSSVTALIHTLYVFQLQFWGSRLINHFFCEVPSLLPLVCQDTSQYKQVVLLTVLIILLIPFVAILASYDCILTVVLQMSSGRGQTKAISTCSSPDGGQSLLCDGPLHL